MSETPSSLFDEIFQGNWELFRRMFTEISRSASRTNTLEVLWILKIWSNTKTFVVTLRTRSGPLIVRETWSLSECRWIAKAKEIVPEKTRLNWRSSTSVGCFFNWKELRMLKRLTSVERKIQINRDSLCRIPTIPIELMKSSVHRAFERLEYGDDGN